MKRLKRILAYTLILCLVMTSVQMPTAFAGRVDLAYIDVNLHHEMIELRFWHQFKQYVHIAVYESGPADPEYPHLPGERGDLIGYIVKYHFANGEGIFPFQRYFYCPVGEDHTIWAISHHDMLFRQYPWPFFPNRLPRNPEDPPYESLGGLSETFVPALVYLPEIIEEEEEYEEYGEYEENDTSYETNGASDADTNGDTDADYALEYETDNAGETNGNNDEELNGDAESAENMSSLLRANFGRAGLFASALLGFNDVYSNGEAAENGGSINVANGESDVNGSNGDNGEANGNGDESSENGDLNGYENGDVDYPKIDNDEDALEKDEEYYEEEEEKLDPEELENRPMGNQIIFGESRTVGLSFDPFNNRGVGFMPFGAEPYEAGTRLIPCPDVPGYNILLWDGRINRNAGEMCDAGFMLEPDWYCVLTNMHQNHNRIQIVVKPIGFPWRNVASSCYIDDYGNYVARPGQNWEWSRGYQTVGRMYYIEGSMWLLGVQVTELPNWLEDWLSRFRHGNIELEELPEPVSVGDPINAVTGSYTFTYTDLKLHGEWPLMWERIYSSIDMSNTGLGQGFSHTYDFRLTEDRGIIYVQTPYGEIITFFRMWDRETGVDFYRPLVGSYFTLASPNNDRVTYEMTFRDGSVFTFVNGLLTRIRTLGGDTIVTLSYDADDNLIRVANPYGQFFNIAWSGDRIVSIIDSAGRTVSYSHSGNNLMSFTNADGDTSVYTYDANGFMASHSDFDGNVFLRNWYDERGRVIEQRMYNPTGDYATLTISYDDSEITGGNVTLASRGVNTVTTFAGEVVQFFYDQNGFIKTVRDGSGGERHNTWNDLLRAETRDRIGTEGRAHTSFTEDGRPTSVLMQDGGTLQVEYTPCGNLIRRITFHDGSFEEFTYSGANVASFRDRNGNTTHFAYTSAGLLARITDPLGGQTIFEHTGSLLTRIIDPMGGITTFEHNAAGMVTRTIGPLGDITRFYYSDGGKLERIVNHAGHTMTFEHTTNGFVTREYDFRGYAEVTEFGMGIWNLPIARVDRAGNRTEYTYNDDGTLASVIDFNGGVTTFEYDDRGRLVAVTDALGNTTTSGFDGLNRVVSNTDALGHTISRTYDNMGRLDTLTDANGVVTRFIYDRDGRVIEQIQAYGTSYEARTRFEFDYVGNNTAVTDANGNRTRFYYDAANRLIREVDPEGRETRFEYDRAGRMTARIDGEGNRTQFIYDAAGNIIREIDPLGNAVRFYFLLEPVTRG